MTTPDTISLLSAAQNVLYIALILKLWRDGLAPKYKLFITYLALQVASGTLRFFIPPRTDAYAYYYFLSQPITIASTFLAISEMYNMVLREHPAIASVGRRFVLPAAVVAAVLLSGVSLLFGAAGPGQATFLLTYFTIEQFLYGSILIVVLLISAFLAFFPVPLTRNVIVHSSTFAVYLLAHATARLVLMAFGTKITPQLNVVLMSCATAALVFWFLRLNKEGERQPARAGIPHFTPEQEGRILFHLDSINATLQKSAKK